MIPTVINHLAFRVSDLDKTSELFQKLGYVEVRRTTHGEGAVEMESPAQPGLILEFTLPKRAEEKLGFDHAGFTLEDEDELKRLVAAGFPETTEPKLVPGSGRTTSNLKDHDGIKWQFNL